MPFITADQLKAKLASLLHVPEAKLTGGQWDQIIADSAASAKNEILARLYARGYSLAQITAWDRVEEFQTDIGLFWCLTKGANLLANFPTELDKLDRREELSGADIVVAGVIVTPADAVVGGMIGSGQFDTTNDLYTRASGDDLPVDSPFR